MIKRLSIVFIFVFIWVFEYRPYQLQRQALAQEALQLTQSIQTLQQNSSQQLNTSQLEKVEDVIEMLAKLIAPIHLQSRSIKRDITSDTMRINIVLTGDAEHLKKSLFVLMNAPEIVITDLDFQTAPLTLSASIVSVATIKGDAMHYRLPAFCGEKTHFNLDPQTALQQISIADIERRGYVQLQSASQSFIALPDQIVIPVKLGTMIGREQGEIIAMNDQAITVRLPNGETRKIQ